MRFGFVSREECGKDDVLCLLLMQYHAAFLSFTFVLWLFKALEKWINEATLPTQKSKHRVRTQGDQSGQLKLAVGIILTVPVATEPLL